MSVVKVAGFIIAAILLPGCRARPTSTPCKLIGHITSVGGCDRFGLCGVSILSPDGGFLIRTHPLPVPGEEVCLDD